MSKEGAEKKLALLKALITFAVVFAITGAFIKNGTRIMGSFELNPITWGEFYLKIPFGFLFAVMCASFVYILGNRPPEQ